MSTSYLAEPHGSIGVNVPPTFSLWWNTPLCLIMRRYHNCYLFYSFLRKNDSSDSKSSMDAQITFLKFDMQIHNFTPPPTNFILAPPPDAPAPSLLSQTLFPFRNDALPLVLKLQYVYWNMLLCDIKRHFMNLNRITHTIFKVNADLLS